MEIQFKTLTPLHIGNGEELFALDYVKNNSVYYRITQQNFLVFLNNDAKILEKYSNWIIEQSAKIDGLKEKKKKENNWGKKNDYNQELSKLVRSFNLLSFIEQNTNKKNEFIKFLENSKDTTKIKLQTEPKNNIRGFIKTSTNHPFIPGSSIKGAIRTALLYKYLETRSNSSKISELIQDEIDKVLSVKRNNYNFKPDSFKKKFADEIEHLAFYCATENKNGQKKTNDEKFDIMKFLSVSDGSLLKKDLILANIDLYLVSKKKDQRTGKFETLADKESQAPCVEAVPENAFIKTDIDFNIHFLFNFKDSIKNDSIRQGSELVWIGIKNKIKDVFKLDIDTLTKENLEQKKQEVFNYIMDAVNEFSKAQLDFDKEWIKNYSEKDQANKYRRSVKAGFSKLFENRGILIHLGYASGFYGITEYLYLFNEPTLKEQFKQVMELFSIGDKPGARHTADKPYIANPDKFPKSRRLVEINGDIKPLGWLMLLNSDENYEETNVVETSQEIKITESPKEIAPEYRNIVLKPNKIAILEGVVKGNNMVEVYMPNGTKKIVRLAGGSADIGKIIEVSINPDGKGNFSHASFKGFKK